MNSPESARNWVLCFAAIVLVIALVVELARPRTAHAGSNYAERTMRAAERQADALDAIAKSLERLERK